MEQRSCESLGPLLWSINQVMPPTSLIWSHIIPESIFTMWNVGKTNKHSTAYFKNYTKRNPSSLSLHTTTFPGRVLPHGVVNEAVVQKREVIVKRCWPTAGLLRCVFGRKPPVVSEVVKDFVIVGLRLPAGSWTVPENHFLAGAVAQTEVRHVEVDLFEHAALSSSIVSRHHARLPTSRSCSTSFTVLLVPSSLPLPPVSSPAARVFFGEGGSGGGRGRWGCRGWAAHSADGHFYEVHHIFELTAEWLLHDVWNTLREMAALQRHFILDDTYYFSLLHHTGCWRLMVLCQKVHKQMHKGNTFYFCSSICTDTRRLYVWVDYIKDTAAMCHGGTKTTAEQSLRLSSSQSLCIIKFRGKRVSMHFVGFVDCYI